MADAPLVLEAPESVAPRRGPLSARDRWLAVAAIVFGIAAIVLAITAQKKHSPQAARLLPESEAIVYVNLRPARIAGVFNRHPVKPDQDYLSFQQQTGIVFERDLDEAAFAIHLLPQQQTAQGPAGFSEVFSGKFDQMRLAGYLLSLSGSVESYGGHTIYLVPHDGRTVRVTILSGSMVAASNMPTPEQIHHIVDAFRASVLPSAGPSLLRDHYADIPLLSFAWAMGRVAPPLSQYHRITLFGVPVPIPDNTTLIASARVLASIRLRVEAITPSEQDAVWCERGVQSLLYVLKGGNFLLGPTDSDVSTLIKTAGVDQSRNRVVLTVSVPPRLAQRLLAEK